MRFYAKKPDKGESYWKKTFAWLPINMGKVTIWLEYYWENKHWSNDRKQYYTSHCELLENRKDEH